jgi:hypothetical protein
MAPYNISSYGVTLAPFEENLGRNESGSAAALSINMVRAVGPGTARK